MFNLKTRIAVLAIVLALAGAIAAGAILRPQAFDSILRKLTGERPAEAGLVLYGNVDIREVELAFRQGGRIAVMAADEGDRVVTGQLVAELDTRPFRDALAIAEAEVHRAEAGLQKLRNGPRPEEIAEAEAAVRQASISAENAERDYQRKRKLFESRVISESDADNARAARDEATAILEARRAGLALLKAGTRPEDITAGEAALRAAQAHMQQAQTARDDARLFAPADGVVLARVLEQGSIVGVGAPVYTLSLSEPVYVRAYVSEPDLGRVAPGTRVLVSSDSSGKAYEGQIGFVSPRAEFTPRSVETTDLRTDLVYRLRIVVIDAGSALRQGMPVTVRLAAPPVGTAP